MLFIMRITIFVLLVNLMQVSANVYSQATKLTLNLKSASLETIIEEIKSQSEYNFLYRSDIFSEFAPVDLNFSEVSLNAILDNLIVPLGYAYEIHDKVVVIRKAEPNPEIKEQQKQQKIVAKGKVVDNDGVPLVGVSIYVKNSTFGTITDINGNYIFELPENPDILVFSYVGFENKEIKYTGEEELNITLVASVSGLDEVVVIGYGTTTKRQNTGSVSSIKSKQLESRPVTNVMQALQGQVSGVSITNFSPGIGSPVKILVRGVNSISSGTNPLIIVDGVVINSNPGDLITSTSANSGAGANIYQQGNNVLNSINPNDIESIDILKDADATSIYGSRGTNGVILITTKKASLGKTKFSISATTGVQSPAGLTKRLNTEEYLKMRKDAFAVGNMTAASVINPITPTAYNAPDLVLWSQTAYTDYPKFEVANPAPTYNVNANMSGGTKTISYLASGSYQKVYDSYLFKPYQERLTGRMQLNHTSEDNRFNIKLSSIFGVENQKFTSTNLNSVLAETSANAPNFELYNPDGTFNFSDGGYISGYYVNPMPMKYVDQFSKTNNLMLSGETSYEILKGLVAKLQVNYGLQANKYRKIYVSTPMSVPEDSYSLTPYAEHTANTFISTNIEPQITYTTQISKAKISALAGSTFLDKSQERIGVTIKDPGSDDLLYSYSSGNPTTAASNRFFTRFMSVFGRLNLNWDKKYIANMTFRRDGSSRFGPNNKFANFASAGFAWVLV